MEEHAGRWLRHLDDSFESQEELKRKATEPKAPKKAARIPPEVEREILFKLKTEHYAGWVDQRLPALDGQTPNEAAKSASGRRALEDLLRTMENGGDRARWLCVRFHGHSQEPGNVMQVGQGGAQVGTMEHPTIWRCDSITRSRNRFKSSFRSWIIRFGCIRAGRRSTTSRI